MPPRIPGPQGLSVFSLCLRPAAKRPTASLQPLVQAANLSRKEKIRVKKQEPYRWAQIEARRAAKLARQEEVERARAATWGSPIHGIPTPFVESFDSVGQESLTTPGLDGEEPRAPLATSSEILDHQLTRQELDEAINMAYELSKPLENANRIVVDAVSEAQELQEHEASHKKAVVALERILALTNSNGKARLHANIRRCVDAFGRHNTDQVLRPRPRAPGLPPRETLQRGGPDTGSSEVQIAILTAKIRVLAKMMEGPKGHKDKVNKRNLRLLCHRRQKLLKYLLRKERGGERWTNLITTLGLTEATWKEQISL
ncbi:ribosomal protein [Niveomyces insectorum RCEF 264]|uniref:Ribosomal protein n=1 Tax=Niveomyces insectorum RCEF 264 TaxID=1081102 RepID=A0A167TT44_9HYPO|nr:ribosomal protein [Niveomyces insectorum RCEF 264]